MLSKVSALVSTLILMFLLILNAAAKEASMFLLILNAAAKKPLKRGGLVSLLIFAADERS